MTLICKYLASFSAVSLISVGSLSGVMVPTNAQAAASVFCPPLLVPSLVLLSVGGAGTISTLATTFILGGSMKKPIPAGIKTGFNIGMAVSLISLFSGILLLDGETGIPDFQELSPKNMEITESEFLSLMEKSGITESEISAYNEAIRTGQISQIIEDGTPEIAKLKTLSPEASLKIWEPLMGSLVPEAKNAFLKVIASSFEISHL